jgi:hypothetical protein
MERFISGLNPRGLSREHVSKAEPLRGELAAHFPSARIDNISADDFGEGKERLKGAAFDHN